MGFGAGSVDFERVGGVFVGLVGLLSDFVDVLVWCGVEFVGFDGVSVGFGVEFDAF